jgi:hypothetical protein
MSVHWKIGADKEDIVKVINIKGKKYGRLVVVERADNHLGRVMWKCVCECGNEKIASGKTLRNSGTRSCGCLHKEQSPKNGRLCARPIGYERNGAKGYIEVKCSDGFKRKHVSVMENHIGRNLRKGEVVHHIDGNKRNNGIENLKIMQHGKHTTLHSTGRKMREKTKRLIAEKATARTIKSGHRGRKLDVTQVREIKRMLRFGDSPYSEIASMFGVTKGSIAAISQGRIWRYVGC